MKFLIVFVFILATAFALSGKRIKSRNIVVPAGRPEGRMTHGRRAQEGQFTYQAFLFFNKGTYTSSCGGTLISHTDILTAAHCTSGALRIDVKLGSTNREHPEILYQVTIDDVITHPDWKPSLFLNDISIIKIPHTDYSAHIQPARLPTKSLARYSFVNQIVVASGWGRTSDANPVSPIILQHAAFKVISNDICRLSFAIPIFPSQLCISTYNSISPCNGDSGGPLVLKYSRILIGITSYGSSESCERNFPGVFTRVTSFLDWIAENSDVSI